MSEDQQIREGRGCGAHYSKSMEDVYQGWLACSKGSTHGWFKAVVPVEYRIGGQ